MAAGFEHAREAVRTQTRKQCIVVGCQELLAPTMW